MKNKILTYALNSEERREPLTEDYLAWKNSVGFRCNRTWKDPPVNNIYEDFVHDINTHAGQLSLQAI